MTSDESDDSEQDSDIQSIPEEVQDLSVEEVYGTEEDGVSSHSEDPRVTTRSTDPTAFHRPGRTPNDDSIRASTDDLGGDQHKDAYSAGFDSPMATRIGKEEDHDEDAERLRELHEGRHRSDGELSIRQSQWDKSRIAEAICSALPLAKHEREKVVGVVNTLDFSKFGQQKGLEPVTLGVVAVVIDERHRQQEDVDGDIVSFTDKYREICGSVDVSMGDLSTIKKLVRESLDEGTAAEGQRDPRRDTLLPEPTPVGEYPREYWENRDSEYWVRNAKAWSRVPDEFKEAIPDEYRRLISNLRQWEPWENTKSESTGEPDSDSAHQSNLVKDPNQLPEDIAEETTAEAEQLLDELDESAE